MTELQKEIIYNIKKNSFDLDYTKDREITLQGIKIHFPEARGDEVQAAILALEGVEVVGDGLNNHIKIPIKYFQE